MKNMKKFFISLAAIAITLATPAMAATPDAASMADSVATVYFIKDITPENLVKIYKALGREATGKVAVKISTGESRKSHQLDPKMIKPLVDTVNGTIVECCTAYNGTRNSPEKAIETARDHGYMDIAKVDIMDAEGQVHLPVSGGRHLQFDIVGKDYPDYDYTLVLSHFKGHAMGGFGGALKNISIGIASSEGKAWIHSAGTDSIPATMWNHLPEQDIFLESMAEASKAIIDHAGDNIVYINVANNLSVDCDCDGNPHTPEMADIGIYASLDPVAVDRACVDAVFNSTDPGKAALIERINSRHGTHTLDYAEQIGLGTQKYKIVTLE